MKYFVIRVSRTGDLAFVAEGEGPTPPTPFERSPCWKITCHRNGQITHEPMTASAMTSAVASMDGSHRGFLGGTEAEPFDSLHDVIAWLLDEKFEHDVDILERQILHQEGLLLAKERDGDEVGVMRVRRHLEDLRARLDALGPR